MQTHAKFCLYVGGSEPGSRLTFISEPLFESLRHIYREGAAQTASGEWKFQGSVSEADERLDKLLSLLEGHGFRPASIHRRRSDREFAYELCREYKEFDLQSTRYMTAGSSNCFAAMAYRAASTGNLQLPPGRLPKGLEIGQAYTWTVVSDTGRSKLEKENLSHVVFRPVEQATKVGGPNVTVDGYWELTSDLVLPPLSKQCVLMNNDGEVFSGDYKAGCFLIEGFYQPAEMHYEAGALKSVEPFDLAMTYEKFGNTATSVDRAHIASQRLYEVCRKYNLKFGGIPVRVDE